MKIRRLVALFSCSLKIEPPEGTRPLYIEVTVSALTRQYLYGKLEVRLYSHLQSHGG